MSNIQLSTNNLQVVQKGFDVPTKLSESEVTIVKASKGKRVRDMTSNEINELALTVIGNARLRLGSKELSKDELKAETVLIVADLRDFNGLTSTEVQLALKSGLNGDFSKDGVVYFSSSNFVQWLKKWIAEKKQPVMKNYTALEQARIEEKPPPTLAEERKTIIQVINQHTEDLRSHRERIVFLNESLEKDRAEYKTINDPAEKHMILKRIAKFDYELKTKKPFEVLFSASLYDDIERFGIWTMKPERKKEIFAGLQKKAKGETVEELKIKAKTLAYNEFIRMLVDENMRVSVDGVIYFI